MEENSENFVFPRVQILHPLFEPRAWSFFLLIHLGDQVAVESCHSVTCLVVVRVVKVLDQTAICYLHGVLLLGIVLHDLDVEIHRLQRGIVRWQNVALKCLLVFDCSVV